MANELYFRQRLGNGPRVLRKITPTANGTIGFDSNKKLIARGSGQSASTAYAVDGAITAAGGIAALTKGSAGAYTLAAPVAGTDDGAVLRIISRTAFAHTVTQASPGFNGGGAASDVATFGGAVGDNMVVIADNGKWLVQTLRNVTLA